jgi:enoyl-CoA hydratase/carnithine racemase
VVAKIKRCAALAEEVPLEAGLRAERAEFRGCFQLADQKEGMAAFLEKRPPAFRDC